MSAWGGCAPPPEPRYHDPRVSDDKRPILPGSCTWCGHQPHAARTCPRTIRTRQPMPHGRDVENAPCPCPKDNT